jgi:hypothetical protein
MRIVRWLVGGWFSRVYLVAVTLAIVWAFVQLHRWGQPTADLAVFWPALVTGPTSWLLLAAAGRLWDGSDLAYVVCVAVGALVNAAVVNGLAAAARRGREMAESAAAGTAQGESGP